MKVVSIVGMAGAGKSEVAEVFEGCGFARIRFGDITDQEIQKRGLPLGEDSERRVREALRLEHGMAAYAILNLPRIDSTLGRSDVVIDGLYSWEEYRYLKDRYGEGFSIVAVWASPRIRHARLAVRARRGLTAEEASDRDRAEIENTSKGGPIAMADFTIINETSLEELQAATRRVIEAL